MAVNHDRILRHRLWAALVVPLALVTLAAACGDDNEQATTNTTERDESVCEEPNEATGSPVLIGIINDEGSPVTNQKPARDAAVAATEYANDCLGGLAGHRIETTFCLTKTDPATALACANEMVSKKVAAVVIAVSSQGDSIVPTVTQAGIPYINGGGQSAAELGTPGTYIWTLAFPGQLANMALAAKEAGFEKVTILASNVGNVVASAKALAGSLFQKQGLSAKVLGVARDAPDVSPDLAAAMEDDPDAVIEIIPPSQCVSLFEAKETQNVQVPLWIIIPCATKDVIEQIGPEKMEGAVLFDSADIFGEDEESRLYHTIMEKYDPSVFADPTASHGYQSMLGLIRMVNAGGLTGEPTPAAIQTAIKAAKNVPVPAGGGQTMTCDGTASRAFKNVCSSFSVRAVMKDGELTDPVVTELPADTFG